MPEETTAEEKAIAEFCASCGQVPCLAKLPGHGRAHVADVMSGANGLW